MIANSENQTVLIVLKSALLPLSTSAFSVASGSKSKLLNDYLHALVIYRNGDCARVEDIEFLGFAGTSFLTKAFSALNGGTRQTRVMLQADNSITIDTIKSFVKKLLPTYVKVVGKTTNSNDLARIEKSIDGACTCAQVFDALSVPAPDDALDILC